MKTLDRIETQVARPLKVLVPLINQDIRDGDEAGMPYYIAAGEKLIEAKESGKQSGEIMHGEFVQWAVKTFKRPKSTLRDWMSFAKKVPKKRRTAFIESGKSMRSVIYPDRAKKDKAKAKLWEEVKKANPERINRIMAEEKQGKVEQAKIEASRVKLGRELAHKLIKIGYRALATQLHPDKGNNGTQEAMSLLNDVASYLRGCANEYQG